MDVKYQRKLAAQILNCGYDRIWIDNTRLEDVKNAVSKSHVRSLIKLQIIRKKPEKGISRARAKIRDQQRKKGRQSGPGTRKGAKNARTPKKKKWMAGIRAIRSELRDLREEKAITPGEYRKYYMRAKGGTYRSRANLKMHLRADGILKEGSHGNQ